MSTFQTCDIHFWNDALQAVREMIENDSGWTVEWLAFNLELVAMVSQNNLHIKLCFLN